MTSGMFDTVERYFLDEEWKFAKSEDHTHLMMGVTGKSGQYACMAIVREDQDVFIFRSKSSMNAPEEKRGAVSEYLARANYGLPIGNFELDFNDGEIAFKTSLDVEGDELTPALIERLIKANLSTMDRYYPGLMKVIYSDITPEEAVETIEKR